ncbi:hypothetical protein, partial [Escherichia coli]|uniref:hypothetical protein n=1 Tax=Escherichia coli TaxID=562 RepID=UPI0034A5D4A1
KYIVFRRRKKGQISLALFTYWFFRRTSESPLKTLPVLLELGLLSLIKYPLLPPLRVRGAEHRMNLALCHNGYL